VARDDVELTSHGATLRGWLYRAPGSARGPGVVMAHGFTAVREMFLDRYAEAFAAAGFTTLVYDHLGFGASDGEPRQNPLPSLQLEGYRDAIRWLGRQPSVDPGRIGIWGTSHSAGQVVMLAAEDLPVRCAVAQLPGIGLRGPRLSEVTRAAVTRAIADGRLDDTVPAVSATADGLGIMFSDGAHEWFTRVSAERAPSWRNELRIGALTEPFRPIDHLAGATVPLLLIVATEDALLPAGEGLAVASAVPKIEVVEIPGRHFDVYEAGFAVSSASAIGWFRRFLGA
jgi:dienelactone hydrolase